MAIIRDSQGPGVIVAWWLGGLFLVSFAAPLSWGLLGRMPIWLAWQVNPMLTFLDLFALTVVGKAVWATLGYLKFGRLSLCVTGNRPAIGGELEATLTLPRVAFAAKYLTVELRCIEIGRPDDGARMDTRQLRNVRVGGVQASSNGRAVRCSWLCNVASSIRPWRFACRSRRDCPNPRGRARAKRPRQAGFTTLGNSASGRKCRAPTLRGRLKSRWRGSCPRKRKGAEAPRLPSSSCFLLVT